ncbi:hypothetical protein CFC21_089321 [Triticum aestivum]|uniref:Zinc finger GRF-type domain-containing protein n=2 Tax=Triticum aestivum TaxID=4565 RepID=A0A9R1IKS2_WHEAT|nr:hypothetical protein CFC21_089321 [Triticum aestivum]
MPSWKDGEESSKEEELANPGTTIDASFCGRAADASIKCTLHLAPCMKYVAFEGKDTVRRFYGCVVPQKQMDVDKDMEKLAISKEKESATFGKMKEMEKLAEEHKELKCILRSQGEIIRNTRKERDEMQKERDWQIEEKKKLEFLVGDLMKAGHGNKDKLAKIKSILDE